MLRFKSFLQEYNLEKPGYTRVLTEALNGRQRSMVDNWVKKNGGTEAAGISAHAIPLGQHQVTIPLEHPEKKVEPHPEVHEHLQKHGYDVHDYKAGLALEPAKEGATKRRQIKIGKALEATNAPPHVKDAFTNDPNRRGAKAIDSGLQVVVSRHPHHVAGMSTDQGWSSCMDLDGGSNRHYLKHDVLKGTHVAYLTKKGDDEVKRPMARIALKPFVGKNTGEKILHPEDRTYGTADSAFEHTVKKWTDKHFPLNPDEEYHKHSDVYDDSGTKFLMHPNKMVDHPDPHVRFNFFDKHPDKVTSEHIDREIGRDYNRYALNRALDHPAAKPEHFEKLAQKEHGAEIVAHHQNTPSHVLASLAKHPDDYVRMGVAENKNTPGDVVDHFATHGSDDEKIEAVRNPNVSEKALRHIYSNNRNSHVLRSAVRNSKFPKDLYHDAINTGHTEQILDGHSNNLDSDHLHAMLKTPTLDVYNSRRILTHPKATSEHIDTAMQHPITGIRKNAMISSKATDKQRENALNDKDYEVRETAIRHHKNPSPEFLHKAIEKNHSNEVYYAHSDRLSQDHIKSMLKPRMDKFGLDHHIPSFIFDHPAVTKDMIEDAAKNHPSDRVRSAANTKLDHLRRIAQNE